MKRFIEWHKEFTNRFMMITGMDSYQIAWFSWVKGFTMGILIMLLFSCGVPKTTTTHNCERMENGKKCLLDHSCCEVYKKRGF